MEESSNWVRPPDSLSLEAGHVHVWRICLEQGDDQLDWFRRVLEPEELYRAGRFRFERLQRHFVASRGFLRYVLGRYLAARPEALKFSYNSYGKPSLDGERSLQFNMSHSHEMALVAVTRDAAVGVDVEHIRSDFASEEIATRFFSRLEVETLKLLLKNYPFARSKSRGCLIRIKSREKGREVILQSEEIPIEDEWTELTVEFDHQPIRIEQVALDWDCEGLFVHYEFEEKSSPEGAVK